jgi:hypothetical protein
MWKQVVVPARGIRALIHEVSTCMEGFFWGIKRTSGIHHATVQHYHFSPSITIIIKPLAPILNYSLVLRPRIKSERFQAS